MSDESIDQPATIHEITETGRAKLASAQCGAKTALATTSHYIRANPWIALAGAALVGGAIVALARPSRSAGSRKIAALRNSLDQAFAGLPSRKEIQHIAKSSGISHLLHQLAKALHISS